MPLCLVSTLVTRSLCQNLHTLTIWHLQYRLVLLSVQLLQLLKRAFVCHAATHKSSRWGNRPEAEQAVPVTTRAATGKDRRRQPDRRCVPAAVLFIVKKQLAKKPGDRHQGAGPRAGQAVRDLMKRFWKGEGDRPKAAAGRARYDTAAMAKDRRGQRDRRCLLLFYQ